MDICGKSSNFCWNRRRTAHTLAHSPIEIDHLPVGCWNRFAHFNDEWSGRAARDFINRVWKVCSLARWTIHRKRNNCVYLEQSLNLIKNVPILKPQYAFSNSRIWAMPHSKKWFISIVYTLITHLRFCHACSILNCINFHSAITIGINICL